MEMIQIDIPMPERCGVCFAMHTDEIGLESWCGIDETARDLYTADIYTKRPEWCPLKEQEAIRPKLIMGTSICDCGKCKHAVAQGMNYCPVCGCRIDWN